MCIRNRKVEKKQVQRYEGKGCVRREWGVGRFVSVLVAVRAPRHTPKREGDTKT